MTQYVHYALMPVKSKRTDVLVQFARMQFDDRPEFAKRLEQARSDAGFENPRVAALRFGWNYDTYIQHERGLRGITRSAAKYAKAFKVSEAWLLTGETSKGSLDPDMQALLALLPHISEAGRRALVASAEAMAERTVEPDEEPTPDRPVKAKAKVP